MNIKKGKTILLVAPDLLTLLCRSKKFVDIVLVSECIVCPMIRQTQPVDHEGTIEVNKYQEKVAKLSLLIGTPE